MAPRKSIKLIAFDLGGVLIDVKKSAFDRLFVDEASFEALTRGHLSPINYFSKVASKLNCTNAEIENAFKRIVLPRPFCDALLSSLSIPFTFWSNINACHFEQLLKQCDALRHHNLPRALSYEIGHLKPEPAFFRSCLSTAQLDPSEILFLDDRECNVMMARTFGINGAVVCDENEIAEALQLANCHNVYSKEPIVIGI